MYGYYTLYLVPHLHLCNSDVDRDACIMVGSRAEMSSNPIKDGPVSCSPPRPGAPESTDSPSV